VEGSNWGLQLRPVILATWETEIRRIMVQDQPRQVVLLMENQSPGFNANSQFINNKDSRVLKERK
jgi:hypothetical protein